MEDNISQVELVPVHDMKNRLVQHLAFIKNEHTQLKLLLSTMPNCEHQLSRKMQYHLNALEPHIAEMIRATSEETQSQIQRNKLKHLASVPTAQIKEFPCKVCGDVSSGVHYAVLTCDSCKDFFKKSFADSVKYTCHRIKQCRIDKVCRNRCKYCRLQKCLAFGMSRQAVKKGRRSREQWDEMRDEINKSDSNTLDIPGPIAASQPECQESGLHYSLTVDQCDEKPNPTCGKSIEEKEKFLNSTIKLKEAKVECQRLEFVQKNENKINYQKVSMGLIANDGKFVHQHKSPSHTGFYSCDLCGYVFQDIGILKNHLLKHLKGNNIPKNSLQCSVCGKSFGKAQYLHIHTRNCTFEKLAQNIFPKFRCTLCSRKFHSKEELQTHEITHNRTCDVCGKTFISRSRLISHMRCHRVREKRNCSLCLKVFTSAVALSQHMNVHTGKRPFKCSKCNETFVSISARENHFFRKHNTERALLYKCKICGKGFFQKASQESHYMSMHSEEERNSHGVVIEMYECHVCGETGRLHALRYHMRKHQEKSKKFECDMCSKHFSSLFSLKTHSFFHNVDTPEKEGDHMCDTCNKGFCSLAALKIHQLQRHIGSVKHAYKCEICQKEFCYNLSLQRHKCIGKPVSQESKVECDECGKKFEEHNLIRHKIKVHSDSNKSIFKCHVCSTGFSSEAKLQEHMEEQHKGEKAFKCTICGIGINGSSNFRRHIKLHHGEKSFLCDICGKGFAQKQTMIDHRRIHTGEKPFHCDICNKSFSDRSTAYKHKLIHKRKDKEVNHPPTTTTSAANGYATQEGLGTFVFQSPCSNFSTDVNTNKTTLLMSNSSHFVTSVFVGSNISTNVAETISLFETSDMLTQSNNFQ